MGKDILEGERVICSKSNIQGVMDKNAKIKPILLKTWTKVEFSGQNDDNDRNLKNSKTIALWEISDGMFLSLGCWRKEGMHVTMATEKRT